MADTRVIFTVNGKQYSVGGEVRSTHTLLEYLRRDVGEVGTKYMCLEGGCGACMVSVVKTPGQTPISVNSCLVAVTSCMNWEITTIQGIGNRTKGYHPLQETLAKFNGSQCGYCSPGMVMNMFNVLQNPCTMKEIERSMGSNICRCTGYRSIMHAFKTYASDAPNARSLKMEDLQICGKADKCCSYQNSEQSDWCMVSKNEAQGEMLHLKLKDNKDWYRVYDLADIFALWRKHGLESYMLVAGNTAKGAIPIVHYPDLLIDISGIDELKKSFMDQNMIIGAGCTLAELITRCKAVLGDDGFEYLNELVLHMDEVAHVSIRNCGTLAGNLMIKKQSPGFQSDVYLCLETCGGQITILQADGEKRVLSMQEFLEEDMSGKVILNLIFPPINLTECRVKTYKIMPRSQSVHALVNGGFYMKMNENNVVQECRITYGALSVNFTRAYKAERYLIGKPLFDNDTLQGLLSVLNDELVVAEHPPEPAVDYRRKLALGLCYKCIISLSPPETVNSLYRLAALKHRETRPVSEGHQVYDTNPNMWPITKPLPKSDGLIQCAGEAQYTDDIPLMPDELFLAFILSTVACGTIDKIDTSRAMALPGVHRCIFAKDIPGINSFIPAPNAFNLDNEELFCDGKVKFFNQPIGVVVCDSQDIANYACTLVDITYTDIRKPVIDINEARKDPKRVSVFQSVKATSKGNDVYKVIKGNNTIYGQYHGTMETHVTVCRIEENGIGVHTATQWVDLSHQAIARCLNIKQNWVYCPRIGGGYGAKLGRANQIATATALATYLTGKPCRFVTPLSVNMKAIGKRMPCSRDFEVGVNEQGVIQYLNCDLYGDNGYVINEPLLALGMGVYNNCYNKDKWNYTAYNVVTDTASNTWCRSPGTLENIAMAELVMERIACELKLDPLEVRLANLAESSRDDIVDMTNMLKSNARYDERKAAVDKFNQDNRWIKRGIRFSLLRWEPIGFMNLDVTLTVCSDDGSITITHGGIEMGQGVNAKAIQIAAYMLKLPVDMIKICGNDSVITSNCSPSGGSITSQNVGIGVMRCCNVIKERFAPYNKDNRTWKEVAQAAFAAQVSLKACCQTTSADVVEYNIHGACVTEVEIDFLTGEYQIIKNDMIIDCGQSVNPEVDCGQIEGAFVMGLGYWTCENLIYDNNTGELLTHNTWLYWMCQALDTPQSSVIHFKRKSYSSELIFGAKGTGEPATCLSVVVTLAMRHAIQAMRKDNGLPEDEWFQIDGPLTMEKICLAAGTKTEDFKIY